jgi:hypothetical protein
MGLMDLCKTRVEIPLMSVSVRIFVGPEAAKLVLRRTAEMSATTNDIEGFML